MPHILSKSAYIKGLQCEKALYLSKKHPYLRDKLTMAQRLKFKRGTDVGVFAQQIYPNGVNMTPASPSLFQKNAALTLENMANPLINSMYEAIFQYDDTLIMVDIITRDGDKWKAIEVKSSLHLSDTYRNDAALQYYVMKGCGIELSDIQLMYLNADYERDGDIDLNKLFKFESVMNYAISQQETIKTNIGKLKKMLENQHSPQIQIGTQCRTPYVCEFMGHCWKKVPYNSILYCSASDDKTLFEIHNDSRAVTEKLEEQLDALTNNTFTIDYKTLFSLIPEPRPNKTAYISLLYNYPAIPEADGERPYQKKLLAFMICDSNNMSETTYCDCLENHNDSKMLEDRLIEMIKPFDMAVCFDETIMRLPFSNKILNLHEALEKSNFFHKLTKYAIKIENIEKITTGKTIEGHEMLAYYASEDNKESLVAAMANEMMAINDIYRYFYKQC